MSTRSSHSVVPTTLASIWFLIVLGGCDRGADSYFPLDEGWTWVYSLNVTTMDGSHKKKYIIENLGSSTFEGQKLAARRSADGSIHYYREEHGGLVRVGQHTPEIGTEIYSTPRVVLPRPLTATAVWSDIEYTVALEHTGPPEHSLNKISVPVEIHYTVEDLDDEVAVPAGRFSRCLRIRGTGFTSQNVGFYVGHTDIRVETTEWYAPNVGLVKAVRKETTTSSVLPGGHYQMELESLSRK